MNYKYYNLKNKMRTITSCSVNFVFIIGTAAVIGRKTV